jgi:hypothetical protein
MKGGDERKRRTGYVCIGMGAGAHGRATQNGQGSARVAWTGAMQPLLDDSRPATASSFCREIAPGWGRS